MRRNDDESIAGAGEFAVGFGGDVPAGVRAEALAEVDRALNDVRDAMAATVRTTNQILDREFGEIAAPAVECVGCVEGSLDNTIVDLINVRNRLREKVESRLDARLGEVAGQLISLFNSVPDPAGPPPQKPGELVVPNVLDLLSEEEIGELSSPPQLPDLSESRSGLPDRLNVDLIGNATSIFTLPADTTTVESGPPATGGTITVPPGGLPTIGFPGGGGGGGTSTVTQSCPGNFLGYSTGSGSTRTVHLSDGQTFQVDMNNVTFAPNNWGGPIPVAIVPPNVDYDGYMAQDVISVFGANPGYSSHYIPVCGPITPGDETVCTGPSCSNVPDPCTLPAGHSWINPDDHSKGYKNDATGAITATPDCVKSGKCPTCSPEKLPPGLFDEKKDLTAAGDPLFTLACKVDSEKEFSEQVDDEKIIQSLGEYFSGEVGGVARENYKQSENGSFIGKAIIWAFSSVSAFFAQLSGQVGQMSAAMYPAPRGCDRLKFKAAVRLMGFGRAVEKWGVYIPEQIKASLVQKMNYHCQYLIPSPPNLDQMRLRKEITEKEWEYGLKLNGVCIDWAKKNYDAVTKFVVPPADLVRFMQRDVFDKKSVETLGLMNDFPQKFIGPALKIAEQNGISRETMEQYWAAHWDNLPPTQIFQMLQRLAPDMDAKAPDGTPVSMTPDKAKELLKIADKPPALINELMAISYLPINRTDAKTLYVTGVIDRKKLVKIIRQAGLTEDDAELSANGYEKKWAAEKAAFSGATPIAELDRLFQSGGVDESGYRIGLLKAGYDADAIDGRVQAQKRQRQARDLASVQGRLRSAYIHGRIDDLEYRTQLTSMGMDIDRAGEVINRDRIVKQVSNKQITVRSLCKLVSQGYMDMGEYIRRAVNLGYSETDAALLAQSCNADILKRRQAEIERDQRNALAAAEKAARKLEREKALARKAYREKFPCKPKPKPQCQNGEQLPEEMLN